MKVLYVASEALPFMASGGLGDVAGSLPVALRKRLIGCRVVMPLYDSIKQEYKDKMKFITSISVPVSWRRQYCGIFEAKHNGVIYYFLDNQYYFKRDGIYGHYDDAERFAFFARAVLEIIPHLGWKPDIIHCNDWQSALTPLYYSCYYANQIGWENIKTVFTIHNIQYQGKYGDELLNDVLGIAPEHNNLILYDGLVRRHMLKKFLTRGTATDLTRFSIREVGNFAVSSTVSTQITTTLKRTRTLPQTTTQSTLLRKKQSTKRLCKSRWVWQFVLMFRLSV